jgi:hypothetical protein
MSSDENEKEFMKWVTEISAWLMSAQAIVLTIIQVYNMNLLGKQVVTVLLLIGIFFSTLTITGAFNFVASGIRKYKKLAQNASNFTVWFFLIGLVILAALVVLDV